MQDITWKNIPEAASKHPLAVCSPKEEAVMLNCQVAPRNAGLDCSMLSASESCQLETPETTKSSKGAALGLFPAEKCICHLEAVDCERLDLSLSMLEMCMARSLSIPLSPHSLNIPA